MKRWLSTVTTAVLVICAVAVTALVIRRELFTSPATAAAAPTRTIPNWRSLAREGHALGPRQAPIVLLEFADYQCPYCAELQGPLAQIRARYPDQVGVVYRHFPLKVSHPHAVAAAEAAECADAAGRFEAFHDLLYQRQDSIGGLSWHEFARRAGVPDLAAFDRCVSTHQFADRVGRDAKAAEELHLQGTPSVFVNGKELEGTPTYTQLEEEVRALLPRQ